MIIDGYLVMSNEQEVLTSGNSTDYIDTLAAGDAVAPGARWKAGINTAFATGDGATLQAILETDDNASFTSATVLLQTGAIAVTAIDAIGDFVVDAQIPQTVQRYIRTRYVVGTGSFSAGKVDSRIVLDTAKTMDKQL